MSKIERPFNDASSARLESIFQRLSTVPEGKQIVDFLKTNGIAIVFKSKGVNFAASNVIISRVKNGHIHYGNCSIMLNENLNDDNLLQSLVHEAQHMRHHLAGLGNPDFWPDSEEEHCLLRRIQEADAQATATYITYILKQQGDSGPYNEVLQTDYAPMCHAFEAACKNTPDALHNGTATRAAFDKWFDSEYQTRFYDRDTVLNHIPFLKGQLWAYPDHGLKEKALTEEWIVKIGALAPVNYMTLPGHPSVISGKYRNRIEANLRLFPSQAPRNDNNQ